MSGDIVKRSTNDDPGPIVLFDSMCNLCSSSVGFMLRHDRRARVRVCAVQSDRGQELLNELGLPLRHYETFVLIDHGRAYFKSVAVLRLAAFLDMPWPLLGAGRTMPKSIRDRLYDVVATNRYRLFGRRRVCLVPTPEQTHRFI